jgi:hypothetical protein
VSTEGDIREFLSTRRARITPQQAGLTLTAYNAAPGTPGHDALQFLATWATTEMPDRPRR